MTKTPIYRYLGENGLVESTIFIPGAQYVKMLELLRDEGMLLTRDDKYFYNRVVIPVSEEDLQYEVKDNGQNNNI